MLGSYMYGYLNIITTARYNLLSPFLRNPTELQIALLCNCLEEVGRKRKSNSQWLLYLYSTLYVTETTYNNDFLYIAVLLCESSFYVTTFTSIMSLLSSLLLYEMVRTAMKPKSVWVLQPFGVTFHLEYPKKRAQVSFLSGASSPTQWFHEFPGEASLRLEMGR